MKTLHIMLFSLKHFLLLISLCLLNSSCSTERFELPQGTYRNDFGSIEVDGEKNITIQLSDLPMETYINELKECNAVKKDIDKRTIYLVDLHTYVSTRFSYLLFKDEFMMYFVPEDETFLLEKRDEQYRCHYRDLPFPDKMVFHKENNRKERNGGSNNETEKI